jgi:SAM-dependent methyltransferase
LFLSDEERRRVRLIEGDLLDLTLEGGFDVIYSFGVMHHVAHERALYEKFHRMLKPDGQLMIAVYSKLSLFHIYMRVVHALACRGRRCFAEWSSSFSENSEPGNPVVMKIRYRSEVESLLGEAGFRVAEYSKRGFVQNYLPGIGKAFRPDGVVLNALARVLGWYHCCICTKTDRGGMPGGTRRAGKDRRAF